MENKTLKLNNRKNGFFSTPFLMAFSTLLWAGVGSSEAVAQNASSKAMKPAPTSTPSASPTDADKDASNVGTATLTAPTVPTESSDKLDVEGLEKKYWSAKDDDFTVVQNRTFTKNKKFYLSLMTGKIVNDGFIEGSPNSASLGYFFNEKNGINIDYTSYVTKNNSVTNQFITANGANPSYNSLLNTTSIRYFWSPIYAKVSLLEKKILYLDFAIGVHVGQTGYKIMTLAGGEEKKTTHYGFDISQLWFLNKSFALRFDIRNTWTNQEQKNYYGNSSADLGSTRFQDNAWLLGFNFFFGKR